MPETTAKPRFQRSADTSLIVTLMGKAEVGELVSYAAIEKILGRNPQTHRQPADSAMRILLNEEGKVFECVANEGFRRLSDTEVVGSTNSIRERQHRLAGKALKRLGTVNMTNLDEDSRRHFLTHSSIQGAMRHATSAKSQKVIESRVNGNSQQLAVAMTLKNLAE